MIDPRIINFIFVAAFATVLAACSSTPPPTQDSKQDSLEIADAPLNRPIRDILDIGLPELLNAAVEYDETILNPAELVDDYLLSEDKAASNLGVYGTDALYFSLYDKTTEYIQYSTNCQLIARELGVSEAFSPEVIKRLEGNIGSPDSIYSILSESMQTADNTLKANGQERLAGLIATGSLIESLHILCHALNSPGLSNANAGKIKQAIIKQKEAVGRIRNRLTALPKDKLLDDVVEKLGKLGTAIAAAQSTKELKSVSDLVNSLRGSLVN